MICPNCGANLPNTAQMCFSCKTVFQSEGKTGELRGPSPIRPVGVSPAIQPGTPAPQQVEITNISLKAERKIIKVVILAAIIIVIGVAAFFVIRAILNTRANAKYLENMKSASSKMAEGASKAEEVGNLLHGVWSNSIWKKDDPDTDKYTKDANGEFNEDFNTSVTAFMTSSEYTDPVNKIKANQDEVQKLMKELMDPPDKYKEAYSALKDYYDSYIKLTNCVVSPSGSLQTFTNDFNDADTAAANCYQKMDVYLK